LRISGFEDLRISGFGEAEILEQILKSSNPKILKS
jgi:hypothetical protein